MHTLSLFLGLLAAITPSLGAATPPNVPIHKFDGPVKPGSHIVKLRDGTNPTGLLGFLAGAAGAQVTHQYNTDFFNAFAGTFDDAAINALSSRSDVEYIAEDGIMSTFDTEADATWNLARISSRNKLANQDPFAQTYTYNYLSNPGSDIDVYVVDTGIFVGHADFNGRARWGGVFCQGCQQQDGNGHGTHVAGTAGGSRFGVAKSANLIAVKVLDDNGDGSVSDIISGLDYVSQQRQSNGRPAIATMSLGGPTSIPLNDAVLKLIARGIHCTVAAGNSDVNAINTSPANTPGVIAVGAMDITDGRAFYSNYGPIVDIFAPGSNVTSTWNDGGYRTISGTSMATPAVAGLVAYYLRTTNPSLSPLDMRLLLQSKATRGKLSNIPLGTPNLLAFNDWNY